MGGVGQVINASDSASGARVGRYVPHGFLHLRGVFGGTLTAGETIYDWRAKHQLNSHFAVSSAGVELAHFDAGPQAQPVRVQIEDLTALEPLVRGRTPPVRANLETLASGCLWLSRFDSLRQLSNVCRSSRRCGKGRLEGSSGSAPRRPPSFVLDRRRRYWSRDSFVF